MYYHELRYTACDQLSSPSVAMSRFVPSLDEGSFKDKVVIITGMDFY
jgi:hypothetical protein